MDVLPMFPLGTVLLPEQPLPLQIFEPRYLTMLRDVAAGEGGVRRRPHRARLRGRRGRRTLLHRHRRSGRAGASDT